MTELTSTVNASIRDAAGVAWADAISLLPYPLTVPPNQTERGTTPTHVTVVAFKGGIDMADAMPNSVLGFLPIDDPVNGGVICETYKTAVRTIGMPLFAVVGCPASLSHAQSPRAIFLPFKTHGLLIYPISPRGNQDEIKSTIKAVTAAFDFPDPACMLTLLNFNIPVRDPAYPALTASGVLSEILRCAWKIFSWNFTYSNYALHSPLSKLPPPGIESFVGKDRNRVMRNMYAYAAYNGIDTLHQTTFDGTVNSVFGSIIYAAHGLGFRDNSDACVREAPAHLNGTTQKEYISEVFDTCFVREFFNHQDPHRFVPRSEIRRWVHGTQAARSEIERPPGQTLPTLPDPMLPILPTLNTVNLIADAYRDNDNLPCNVSDRARSPRLPCHVYANTINTMSVNEVDVLAASKLILSQNPPANSTAKHALQGAIVIDLAAISSENLRRTTGDYCFIMFGYRAESHRDTHKNRDAAIVLFHVCAINPHDRGKREANVTALYAILPMRLNSVKEPAIVLGRFAEKAAAAIKAARLVLSRTFPTSPSRTSTRPEQFNVGMSVTGPMFGANAINGLVMAKAFLLLGGSVRANVRSPLPPEAEAGVVDKSYQGISSVSIDSLNRLDLRRITSSDDEASDDSELTLSVDGIAITSLRMFV